MSRRPNAFLDAFLPFQERVARLGVRNSLVQTALKLTLPGMPDIYQGAELWDLSLVDPDNRRPVDYGKRIRAARTDNGVIGAKPPHRDSSKCLKIGTMAVSNWPSSLPCWPTAAIIRSCLHKGDMSRSSPPAPKPTRSAPLLVAIEEDALVVAAARFPVRCEAEPDWSGTEIPWPQAASGETHWRDLFSGRVVERRGERVSAATVLEDMPVAVLVQPQRLRPRALAKIRCNSEDHEIARRRIRCSERCRWTSWQGVLADHRAWLDSDGQSGEKADLSHAQLQGLSMWSADLREADLSHASLQGANLDHARLRGANLRHANIGSCLAVAGQPAQCRSRATPASKSQTGPRRSFGCQSAQRRSHRSLTLGNTVVGSSARACSRDYRRAAEERASRLNFGSVILRLTGLQGR